ncbi:MAG: permease prefix domain 1-containing protein [Candidatus Acidiferrum sp.]
MRPRREWEELVRAKLAGLAIEPREKREVIEELAAHLEESYEALLREGVAEQAAVQRALSQVTNWQDLQRKILIAKRREHTMQKRLHQLWIPGFLMLILSMVFLPMLQSLGFQPRSVSWSGPGTILLYLPWLLSLPFLGAIGAYISSRAGGSRGTVLLASIFPALALTGAFLSMFPIGFILGRIIGRQVGFGVVATTLLRDGIGWLLVPGAALLAGGLLVQFLFSRRSSSQDTVIG